MTELHFSCNQNIGTQSQWFEGIKHECIIKGDSKYLHIASASILAKVARDTYMETLSSEFNERYDWNNNKGYGTKKHIEGIKKYGLSKFHRQSFNINY